MNVKFIGFELKRKKENIKNSKEREGMNKIQRNYFKKTIEEVWWSTKSTYCPSRRVRISARVLPTVWTVGRQITM